MERDCHDCDKLRVCAYSEKFQELKADAKNLLCECDISIFRFEVKCTQWNKGNFTGSRLLESFPDYTIAQRVKDMGEEEFDGNLDQSTKAEEPKEEQLPVEEPPIEPVQEEPKKEEPPKKGAK